MSIIARHLKYIYSKGLPGETDVYKRQVYSGTLETGSYVYNATKGKRERIGRILQMHANHREEIEKVYAGDIAAAVGLKQTTTGDTLCDCLLYTSVC